MTSKHIGSAFSDFLEEDGRREEAEAIAVKRVLAWRLAEAMTAQRISKAEMARRMKTSRKALDRLLDPENVSVTLITMEKAAHALNMKLMVGLI